MPPDRDEDLLADIVGAARAARSFVEGMEHADFTADLKTQSAETFSFTTTERSIRLSSGPP